MEISWAPAMYVIGHARACSLGLVAAAPIVRVRVPQLARTGVRARLQPAEVVARSAGGVRARAGGCEIRAGAPRVRRAPATLTLQLVQIGQNPVSR
jgi:hypothetical protein